MPQVKLQYKYPPSGNCPVQAEGMINGRYPFYFRARGTEWALHVHKEHDGDPTDCWSKDEYKREAVWSHSATYAGRKHTGDGDRFSAGWADPDECEEFIEKAANRFIEEVES